MTGSHHSGYHMRGRLTAITLGTATQNIGQSMIWSCYGVNAPVLRVTFIISTEEANTILTIIRGYIPARFQSS